MIHIHILLADDDEDDRFFFEKAFSAATMPAQVTAVEDGEQLSHLLKGITHPPPPDIIFLILICPAKTAWNAFAKYAMQKDLKASLL